MMKAGLSFNEACAKLRSTMPEAEFYEFERYGEKDRYGLPVNLQVVSVSCYEPRLTNAVRKIGNWTFLIDNRFISFHVQKIAGMWLLHEGGRKFGERKLMRSLRYCFKRFFAESLVSLGSPPLGRSLLLESILFERGFYNELQAHLTAIAESESSMFFEKSNEAARNAILICQRHELGHYLLSLPGENMLDRAAKILDGAIVPLLQNLISEGNRLIAEEIFCDAFALNSIIRLERDYPYVSGIGHFGYSALHLDEVRSAYFCYSVMMELSRVWFRAFKDARADWDPAEQSGERPDEERLPLEVQGTDRAYYITQFVNTYILSKNGNLHDREAGFYFALRFEQLLSKAAWDIERVSESDELSGITRQEREIARFLTAATWFSEDTNKYLVQVSRLREFDGWLPIDEPPETEEAPIAETSTTSHLAAEVDASAAADHFWNSMKYIYHGYAQVFDAILADIIFKQIPAEGTVQRVETFKTATLQQMEEFGHDDQIYQEPSIKNYIDRCRLEWRKKLMDLHLLLLTLISRTISPQKKLPFSQTIAERLSFLEAYATRNQGANIAAFASILIPELETGQLMPTTII
ncbi:MAG TPA: hypothetical protein VHA56_02580 [Mucilaginibacter sp.]|nr:hypothetical protein [Mucilaginibacter sp.]